MCDLILFMTKISPVPGLESKKVNVDVSYLDTSSNTLIVSTTDAGVIESILGNIPVKYFNKTNHFKQYLDLDWYEIVKKFVSNFKFENYSWQHSMIFVIKTTYMFQLMRINHWQLTEFHAVACAMCEYVIAYQEMSILIDWYSQSYKKKEK